MRPGRLGSVIRGNLAFIVVVVIAALIRIAVALAYWPALFWFDSWHYVDIAYSNSPVGIAADRPSGYPLILRLLFSAVREPVVVTTLQHLAGLTVGALTYTLLVRLGIRRGLAAAVAASVLLNSYAIALEQYVLAEAFFGLALFASSYLLITRHSRTGLAVSGLLMAAAVLMRTVGLFAVPVWLLYLAWRRREAALIASGALAVALPLLAYAAMHSAAGSGFGITQSDGWALYSRVGRIADCRKVDVPKGTRRLCEPGGPSHTATGWYFWDPASPANRSFGGVGAGDSAKSNQALGSFAKAVIRDRPGAYASIVARDLARYLGPRGWPENITLTLPDYGKPEGRTRVGERHRRHYLPNYERRIAPPAGDLQTYQHVLHMPPWLLGLAVVLVVGELLALIILRTRPAHAAEAFLLCGMGVSMLAAASAANGFIARYAIPLVPLLVCAGTIGAVESAAALRRSWRKEPTA